MSLSIDLGNWNSVFAVPSSVVDKYIKLSGSAQLKVLLFILRHAGKDVSVDDISQALSLSSADVKDAMGFWEETKLICMYDNKAVPFGQTYSDSLVSSLSENAGENIVQNNLHVCQDIDSDINKKPRQVSRSQKPDPVFVAERLNSSSEINYLMQEAQIILSRPISNSDAATLLMLHDTDGLPVDVILMLLQYAVSCNKVSMRYIEKVAISWGIEEIDTVEKAEEKIRLLEKNKKAWNAVQSTLGIDRRSPTEKENEAASRWVDVWKMPEDLIKEAYDRCVNAKGKYILNYMDSIIKRWHSCGINTIELANEEKKNKKIKNANEENFAPSYDIDDYFESMDTFA